MNLDDGVRFVTILDKSGEVLFGGQREGIQNYLSEDDQKKSMHSETIYKPGVGRGGAPGSCLLYRSI